ncbi:MAG: HAMP domain-containing histidine kinase, partial [Deltaproteobacteria bacterium]|nr:HAMP domain-containing histidine kinase [Deltaproteobacteria bacterium]
MAGPPNEARRLSQRLSRAGIPTAPDDGVSRAEVMVTLGGGDLTHLKARAVRLLAVGLPSAPKFAAGADDVVSAAEPEVLFRRVRALIERADLEAKLERMTARLKALDEGLAEAAHDLRGPLHAAIGHAELLANDPKLNASQKGSAQAAARQATRAVQMAERILEGAGRKDREGLQVRAFQLATLLEGAIAAVKGAAKEKGLTLTLVELSRPLTLRGDTELLARLLDNLLANALRHTQRGEIELSATRSSPKTVRLCVRDTGSGIA